jgi:hypothetical protein
MAGRKRTLRFEAKALRISVVGLFAILAIFGTTQVATAQLLNPCPYTNDGDCDEPNGLNLCAWGTDANDCSNPFSNFGSGGGNAGGGGVGGPNSCFPFDGDCDEPNGLGNCPWGTDTSDCSNPNSNFGGGSGFAGGGGSGFTGLANPCPYTNDNDCDEPNGLNLCAWGTDTNDCSNPRSNFGNGSGYAGTTPVRPSPSQPQIASTQQGVQLQTTLNYFGFNAGFVDGQIGAATRAAIERFQAAMGYPINGRNFPLDQSGFLAGAYAWATTQGGAVQSGLSGQALLNAYRSILQGAATPVQPGLPLQPNGQAAMPQIAGQGSGFQQPIQPRPPGRGSGRSTSLLCPTTQNSDGFILTFNGYFIEYFLDDDGSTGAWLNTDDDSTQYDTYYHPLGLMLETWQSDSQGEEIGGTRETVAYQGAPTPIPHPAFGVVWTGTETATFSDGTTEQYSTSAQVLPPVAESIGACTYTLLPIVITRTNSTNGESYQEAFAYLDDFDIVIFGGQIYPDQPPQYDEPLDIMLRPDDGFGPQRQ